MIINEIEKEIERLQNLLIEEKNKYKLPRAENQTYYYITSNSSVNTFGVLNTNDAGGGFDNNNYYRFNYFTDENKAKQYADHIKLELELFQTRDMINDGWKPDWSNDEETKYTLLLRSNKLEKSLNYNDTKPFVFGTEEKRDKFIELVGKDKIKQYLSF